MVRGLPWQMTGRLGKLLCLTTLVLDPSRPCQVNDDLLALWLPRGRGRDALAQGLFAAVDVCDNPRCLCTVATLQAHRIDDRAELVVRESGKLRSTWRSTSGGPARPEDSAVLEVDFMTGAVVERGGGKPPPAVAPFFEEPLPFWVLDHLCALWRFHAHDLNLVPSVSAYLPSGQGPKQRLRFTKSGDPKLEEAYARHYVWPGKGPFHMPVPR